MNRREFLVRTVPAATLPLVIGGLSFKAYGRSPLLEALVASSVPSDRVLVVIQMNGGNDGLNTVIPLDEYPALTAARSNILIDEAKVLWLQGNTGLHPAMGNMKALFDVNKLAIVQAVSYPNPNFSHFRATDIWLTGADSNETLDSGWMGRFLNDEYVGYPTGYPSADMPDPLAIQIGSVISPGLQGSSVSMGLAVTNPSSSYILPGGSDTPPNTPAGHELTFIRQVAQETQLYTAGIKTASSKGTNVSTLYPAAGKNSLADQMKIVARLISGGLKTRIYIVNIGGFDTHASQAVSGATETGTHATLLGKLSDAIYAFQDDLRLQALEDRVIGMTFSEFGRRIKSNASLGTDHGTAAPMFVFGTGVSSGVYGTSPALPATATVNDNIPMQFDFRWVYASILQNWFEVSPTVLQDVLASHTQTIPIINTPGTQGNAGGATSLPTQYSLYQNFPNPFNPSTTIRYDLPLGGHVTLEVFNTEGQRVATLIDSDQAAGKHEVVFHADGYASGAYLVRLRAGVFIATKKAILVR
jgi:uncharacterized protein (DUF1501 family)